MTGVSADSAEITGNQRVGANHVVVAIHTATRSDASTSTEALSMMAQSITRRYTETIAMAPRRDSDFVDCTRQHQSCRQCHSRLRDQGLLASRLLSQSWPEIATQRHPGNKPDDAVSTSPSLISPSMPEHSILTSARTISNPLLLHCQPLTAILSRTIATSSEFRRPPRNA